MHDEAQRLFTALAAMPPREARLLRRRILEGASREACAAFLGVSQEAFDVLLARALAELQRQLEGDALRALGTGQEEAAARDVRSALEGAGSGEPGGASTLPGRGDDPGPEGERRGAPRTGDPTVSRLAARLSAHREALLRQLLAEAAKEASEPRGFDWVRWALIVIAVGVALWLTVR